MLKADAAVALCLSVLALGSAPLLAQPTTTAPSNKTSIESGGRPALRLDSSWELRKMGCSPGDRDCRDDERPVHNVQITKGFWLGQTEVTVGAWKRYRLANNKRPLKTKDDLGRTIWNESSADENAPTVMVTWKEAEEFCGWAGGTLPTEAQWEYAARAGEVGARYGDPDLISWTAENSGSSNINARNITNGARAAFNALIVQNNMAAHAVGQKQPNAWGLHDMLGNVSEWVEDWYVNYAPDPSVDPKAQRRGDSRARRGGSWRGDIRNARVSGRLFLDPGTRDETIGFRCSAVLP